MATENNNYRPISIIDTIISNAENLIKDITGNEIRLIVKHINKVNLHTTHTNDAKQAEPPFIGEQNPSRHLQHIICKVYNLSWQQINSKNRCKTYCAARHAYCYIMHCHCKYTYQYIAKELNKNHASIIHAVKLVIGYFKVKDNECDNIIKVISMLNEELK